MREKTRHLRKPLLTGLHGIFTAPKTDLPILLYAAAVEILELSLLAFALLLTGEAVLPGIVSSRISLSFVLFAVLLLAGITIWFGGRNGVSFPFSPDKRNIAIWTGIAWLAFLLTISSVGFPPFFVPILVTALFLAIRLFWKILFRGE